MKRKNGYAFMARSSLFLTALCIAARGLWAATQVVQFGGSVGFAYSPKSFAAHIGDTVKWQGDFAGHPLSSTSVPSGAQSWHVTSGSSFTYRIAAAGAYSYRCDFHFTSGMTGSFTASESTVRHAAVPGNTGRMPGISLVTGEISGMLIATITVRSAQKLTVQVFDLPGHLIATVMDRAVSAGIYPLPLDAVMPSSGIYFVKLSGTGTKDIIPVFRSN